MKKMQIFEPAMCCSTGLCGVGVDSELLRISTVLNTMEKNGITVERFNLSNNPQEFVTNKEINQLINEKGVDELPATLFDGKIIITGRYPENDEFVNILEIPMNFVSEQPKEDNDKSEESCGCCCSGGNCC